MMMMGFACKQREERNYVGSGVCLAMEGGVGYIYK